MRGWLFFFSCPFSPRPHPRTQSFELHSNWARCCACKRTTRVRWTYTRRRLSKLRLWCVIKGAACIIVLDVLRKHCWSLLSKPTPRYSPENSELLTSLGETFFKWGRQRCCVCSLCHLISYKWIFIWIPFTFVGLLHLRLGENYKAFDFLGNSPNLRCPS